MSPDPLAKVPTACTQAVRVRLVGKVQGIGYRPALARLACRWRLSGWVRNTTDGILIHAEGPPGAIAQFTRHCLHACPPGGEVSRIETHPASVQTLSAFRIIPGELSGVLSTPIPVDRVTCADCMAEANLGSDRRYGYHLNSCSQCGPRYTILDCLPYERQQTSMGDFPMCPECEREFQTPADRRYHAQTTCCPNCGPNLTQISGAVHCLHRGGVLGIKGLGGYQLVVMAGHQSAIEELRRRKARPNKPLAVMVADLPQADQVGCLDQTHVHCLTSASGPIVIVPLRRSEAMASAATQVDPIAWDAISPGLRSIGLMLPTTPLHAWLARQVGPLIVTSANLESEPIAYSETDTQRARFTLADHWIDHNRPIRRPVDDSVVRVVAKHQAVIRLARGLAPAPLQLPERQLNLRLLAVGAHQKVAIAICNGRQAALGPHLGDMDTTAARRRFAQQVQDWLHLYRFQPAAVVHDMHPEYFTTSWAKQFAFSHGIPSISVQHHHAHLVSGMLEAGWLPRTVLGFAWDGTGFGPDGTIWGGETLVSTVESFQRVASVRPFVLLGGEAAMAEPARIAAVLLREVSLWDRQFDHPLLHQYPLESLLRRQHPATTSIGRLFDAAAAIVLPGPMLGNGRSGYEGHFASLLEAISDGDALGEYPVDWNNPSQEDSAGESRLDWRPLFRAIVEDQRRGTAASVIAMRFHRSLARSVAQTCRRFPDLPVVLAGGVFQNRILVELIMSMLAGHTSPVMFPTSIPTNDGGLAAGQLAVAAAKMESSPCV